MKFGIIFGAKSYEHEISIVSAIALKNVINGEIGFVFCDKFREFYLIDLKDMRANFFSSGKYKNCKKLSLKQGGFYVSGLLGDKKLRVETYINLIHGMDGEDGKIAALLDFFGVRYIGPRLEASALSYNKELTKFLARKAGVKTLDYEVIDKSKLPSLKLPVIIKPLCLGSSIGVSVVKEDKELEYALDVAYEFDKNILVEPFIEGVKEYNLAGYKANGEIKFSIIEEPRKKEFLDYEQKYMSFSGESRVKEADISEDLKNKLRSSFEKIYNCGFDGALIRCDFFVIGDEAYLNEINPNPGSLANYLFSDFNSAINELSVNLPREKEINVDYKFINSITSAKGKL